MTPVKSSNIEAVDYDEQARKLTVRFKGGKTWTYADVPKPTYDTLMAAQSIGKYFHAHIRSKHKASAA
jgi:hypothetical protein